MNRTDRLYALVEELRAAAPQWRSASSLADHVERRVVQIEYVDKIDEFTSRTVEPVAVLGVQPHWYLWAFCRLRQAPRAFRLDRIRSATVLDETVRDRGLDPADIELDELINRGILGDRNRQATGK